MNDITMEGTVLQNLMNSESFYSKVYSHIDVDLFQDPNCSTIFSTIKELTDTYNKRPSPQEVGLFIKESNKLNKTLQQTTLSKFKEILRSPKIENMDFLIDKTQQWVQRIKLSRTIFTAADIIQNDGEFGPIVGMVEDALNINFDTSIGLDYNESLDERLEYYKSRETFTSTGIKTLDKTLGGGIRPSSLFMIGAATHGGKTAFKIFLSASLLLKKENVLFITLELPEKEISKRIDANLFGVTINELGEIPNNVLIDKWNKVKPNLGNLIIKEYGAGTFNAMNLKSLLDELRSKKDFVPDAVVIDYVGLMVSARTNKNSNSYDTLGKVSEDLHAIAKETYDSKGNKGIKMITSAQLNRSAYGNIDAGMESVSESLKIMMTADVAILLINNEQMREMNQQLFKFVKNRYTGKMDNLMMEVIFDRISYRPFGDEDYTDYEPIDQVELNTGIAIQPVGEGLDFGSLNF